MVRRLVLTVLILGALVAPTAPPAGADEPERYLDRVFGQVTVTRDVAYGAAPDEHGVRQELNVDVYTPVDDGFTTRPAIILAHGGGFVGGSKASMGGLATACAQRGFVAMSIEYRMDEAAGGIGYPPSLEQIARIIDAKHDMQAAVRWARANAATYGIHPQKVAVGGGSAGAVMAVVTAIMPDDPGSSGTPGISSAVCTAVSLMGAGDPALVDADDAGAIFFHGTADTTVPYSQAVATKDAMDEAGLATELVTFPGAGHGIPDPGLVEQRSSEWMVDHVVWSSECGAPAVPAHAAFVRAAHQDLLSRPANGDEVAQGAGLLDVGGSKRSLLARLTSSDWWLGSIVSRFYLDTLGRAPDDDGRAYWVEALRSGRSTVAQVAASFYAAPEYRDGTTAGWIGDLYDDILGRPAASGEVAYWSAQVARHGPSWVAVRLYGSLESRRDRVVALYDHLLDRAPEPDGLAYWADRVAITGDLALARDLAASAEYEARAVERYP